LQLLTRPFEFFLLLASAALYLGWIARHEIADPRCLRKAAVLAALVCAAVTLSVAQNKAVTGTWSTMPYVLSRYQYGVPATFTFQPNAVPHRALTPEQDLDYRAQAAIHGEGTDGAGAFLGRLVYRVRFYRFFLFAPLYFAVIVFVVTARKRADWWVILTVVLFALGTNIYPYFYPHYLAAEACLFVLIALVGLVRISARVPQIGGLLMLFCGAQFLFWYGLHAFAGENLWDAFAYEPWEFVNYGDAEGRIAIGGKLNAAPGPQLVFVRYWPGHEFHEWVQNAADMDGAHIVWALDLGPEEDLKLLRYYPRRRAWLLEPDARPPKLSPYSGE
jgi:hypothetical protein